MKATTEDTVISGIQQDDDQAEGRSRTREKRAPHSFPISTLARLYDADQPVAGEAMKIKGNGIWERAIKHEIEILKCDVETLCQDSGGENAARRNRAEKRAMIREAYKDKSQIGGLWQQRGEEWKLPFFSWARVYGNKKNNKSGRGKRLACLLLEGPKRFSKRKTKPFCIPRDAEVPLWWRHSSTE